MTVTPSPAWRAGAASQPTPIDGPIPASRPSASPLPSSSGSGNDSRVCQSSKNRALNNPRRRKKLMKLKRARVTNYRSVKDSGWIDFEPGKTIFVGPNEAGKSAILRALQQINAPKDVTNFDPLRDYPRGEYNDITRNIVDQAKTDVVIAYFELDGDDKEAIDEDFRAGLYVFGRCLDNSYWAKLEGVPEKPTLGTIRKDLQRLAAHVESQKAGASPTAAEALETIITKWTDRQYIQGELAPALKVWLRDNLSRARSSQTDS